MDEFELAPDDIGPSYVPKIRDGVGFVEIDGEGLAFDEERRAWHLLSPAAAVIYRFCDGSVPVDTLARDIAEAFDLDESKAQDDVLDAVRTFGRQGLLSGVEDLQAEARAGQDHIHDHDRQPSIEDPAGEKPRFLQVPGSS